MLLQTNSYIVPKDKRTEHARLLQRFRQCLARLGCEHFEAYEQVGANWSSGESTGRFVQLMRFRDRKQQQQVQAAERSDPSAQALIKEFCELINFPYQQQQGLFAVGFYQGIIALAPQLRQPPPMPAGTPAPAEASPAAPTDQPEARESTESPGDTGDADPGDVDLDEIVANEPGEARAGSAEGIPQGLIQLDPRDEQPLELGADELEVVDRPRGDEVEPERKRESA
jgi:hypothetical protein